LASTFPFDDFVPPAKPSNLASREVNPSLVADREARTHFF